MSSIVSFCNYLATILVLQGVHRRVLCNTVTRGNLNSKFLVVNCIKSEKVVFIQKTIYSSNNFIVNSFGSQIV